jgi:predicted nuclease of predicted toxin-antitoxin system
LITEDKDFGELVFRLQLPHHGVLLLRLNTLTSDKKVDVVTKVILAHLEDLADAYSVFDGLNLRVRR